MSPAPLGRRGRVRHVGLSVPAALYRRPAGRRGSDGPGIDCRRAGARGDRPQPDPGPDGSGCRGGGRALPAGHVPGRPHVRRHRGARRPGLAGRRQPRLPDRGVPEVPLVRQARPAGRERPRGGRRRRQRGRGHPVAAHRERQKRLLRLLPRRPGRRGQRGHLAAVARSSGRTPTRFTGRRPRTGKSLSRTWCRPTWRSAASASGN